MSFHVKRSDTANVETLYVYNGIRSTRWVKPPTGRIVRELQTTHTPTALQKIPADKNYLTPPYHWHWYQDEFFYVREGRYIFTLEGKDTMVSASDPQPVHIPAKARHTFRVDDTHEGPCTIEIEVDESATSGDVNGPSEKFFRNIYTYLDDCYTQGVSPSLPQLLLLLDEGEMSLAFPWGPDWLMHAVSYTMGVVVGRWWGGYVLGYKASYPEYYKETREGKKTK